MIRIILMISLLLLVHEGFSQEEELETLIEEISELDETSVDNDEWIQQLHHLRSNPIRINKADQDELSSIVFLNAFQISQLLLYRNLLGDLISVYELQAVPGWDNETIRRVIPYVTVDEGGNAASIKSLLTGGNGYLVAQTASNFPRGKGYHSQDGKQPAYSGNPWRYQLRGRYQFKQLFQYGFTLEKDPGEPLWFSGKGVDFQSFHLQIRKMKKIETFVLGDFVVNMGQGLLQWQGMAFGKGSNVVAIKRNGPVLKAYSGAGEYNFHRGVGVTSSVKNVQYSIFASSRKLSATIEDTDDGVMITSISKSGLHRTQNELDRRQNISMKSAGMNITSTYNRFNFGMNMFGQKFSGDLAEKDGYQLYGISGDRWAGASMDLSFTGKKGYWFGEAAVDYRGNTASLLGCLLIPHSAIEWVTLVRVLDRKYQSWNGNAFTSAGTPSNESGIYTGWRWYPGKRIQVDGYADFYRWPWLRYRISSPSLGSDYRLTVSGRSRKTNWSVQYRLAYRPLDGSDGFPFSTPLLTRTSRIRFGGEQNMPGGVQIRMRWELVNLYEEMAGMQYGNLWYSELRIPLQKPRLRLDFRMQYFETDSYSSRIYAAEREVLFHQSAPAYYGRGWKSYLMFQYAWKKRAKLWLRGGYTSMPGVEKIGSGQDEISGDKKMEFRFQVQWLFGK